jgi:hypothetical protein
MRLVLVPHARCRTGEGLRTGQALVDSASGPCGLERNGARNNKSFSVIICYIGKEAYSSFGPFGSFKLFLGLLNFRKFFLQGSYESYHSVFEAQ